MSTDPRWTDETKMLVRRHIASTCAAIASAPGMASPYDISIERAKRLLAALADAGLLIPPGGEARTWTLPAEPGPEVKAVRDRCGQRWERDGDYWSIPGRPFGATRLHWATVLVANHPLTDATEEDR